MAVCALGCYQLERLLPALTQVLPFAGALYLFWLALHLLRSTPAKDVSPRSTFWSGFFLQFVNGKIILYADVYKRQPYISKKRMGKLLKIH